MAVSPALPSDLTSRSLRTLSTQEIAVGTLLLGDAWNIITSRISTVSTRLDATPADLVLRALIVQIQCAMVLRVLNNPGGTLEESVDDYTIRRDAAVSTGALYLSDLEVSLIGSGGTGSEVAFTIKPAGLTPDANSYIPAVFF